MNNLILVGMPSCGKSTMGRLLSKELKYDFVDTDDVIIRLNGCPLRDILDREGLDGFKKREEEAICSVRTEHTVIATGGIAQFIVPLCRREMKVERDLLLKGLNIIYKKNMAEKRK